MDTVPPILLSMIACERVILDRFSGMGSVIGIMHNISATVYPARHGQIVLFCELTNGHGTVDSTIKLVDINEDDKVVFEKTGQIQFKNVKQIQNLVMNLQGIVFPHEGEYRFQLFVGEHLLGERRIVCRKVELPKTG